MSHSIPIVSSEVMNKVLQVTKMVLWLEYAFIVKQYYEIHLLKRVHDDFI